MTPDRNHLIALRISLARIAQAAGMTHAGPFHIEGRTYTQLHMMASTCDDGWNVAAIDVMKHVENARVAHTE